MSCHRRAVSSIVVGVLMFLLCPTLLAEPLLRIGVAEVDITPPEGYPMAGYYHERLATGTANPLKAKALVFLGEQEGAALVVCDLTGIAMDLTQEVRKIASERTGLRPEHITVAGTHSHTAPDYSGDLYRYLTGQNKDPDAYPGQLIQRVADAVVQAHQSAQPVELATGSAQQTTPISFNRRFVMRDGSVRTWMSLANPDVVKPAGPIDPEVGILLARSTTDGKPVAVLSNFALHLDTVGGTMWHADYPYHVEQSIRQALGPEVISIFGTGCCGDINHSDPRRSERNTAEFIGTSLGQTVLGALPELQAVAAPQLHVRSSVVRLPLQEVSQADVARSEQLVAAARAGTQVEFFELVTAYKTLLLDHLRHLPPLTTKPELLSWGSSRTWKGIGPELPVEVQVISLGPDLAIVCLPGEVFVDLGLAIKQASPFRTTLIVELSNAVETVYLPTRAAYAGGGYEVTNAACQPGSGEMLVEAAVRLLREVAQADAESRARR